MQQQQVFLAISNVSPLADYPLYIAFFYTPNYLRHASLFLGGTQILLARHGRSKQCLRDLVVIQQVKWDRGGTELAGE
jgi:hypothetical protein